MKVEDGERNIGGLCGIKRCFMVAKPMLYER